VGLIARKVEEAGIPTVFMTSALDITRLVKPPRSVFLNFPLGHTTGRPFDKGGQIQILKGVLEFLVEAEGGGDIKELPDVWGEDLELGVSLQGSSHK
jgi:D-proline reductase (dithiol) PrdB